MKHWWQRRTLHARLALLVTGAVAAAVLVMAAMAWVAVAEIQRHQIESQLQADARAIVEQPDQWLATSAKLPYPGQHSHGRELGPRWQIIDANATVLGAPAGALPVTDTARTVAKGHHPPVQEQITIDGEAYTMLSMDIPGGGAVQVAFDEDRSQDTLALLGALLAACCVAGIGGAALLGRSVARAGLRPVERITGAVEDVAVTMDLARPIEVRGDDEIARLGRSVNTLLAAVDASRRAQRTLVEDAGHELRTPLTSIRTNVELLIAVDRQPELAHRLPAEERRKLLDDLDAQVQELSSLTGELVELAREDTTREQADRLDLREVVTAAIDRVRIRVPGITFVTELAPFALQGRPGELERMVVNVLDNAAKWSPPSGTVHVELRADGRLTVTDQGPGIDEADRPHVFDRFYRAPAARSMPGSGLGLAIVAQTAAQHGGTVAVAAAEPRGTVVTISLPEA